MNFEVITSWPLLLNTVARHTQQAGQQLPITSGYADIEGPGA